jgi:fatty-acyl-CoA synthase
MAIVLSDALKWWVKARPDATALVFGDEEVTYRHLGEWSDRVATDLAARGVGPGTVVAVAGANSIEWCIAALATFKSGATLTPFNFRFTPTEYGQLIDNCSPVVAFADETESKKLEDARMPDREFDILPLAGVRDLEEGPTVPFRVVIDPDAPALLAYTSGTTGLPKGVILTHTSMFASLFDLMLRDPMPPEATTQLLALPLFTLGGIEYALAHTVARGGKLIVMKELDPELALRLLAEHKVSQINGVPVIYERMSAVEGFDKLDLSHIKLANIGGARVSGSLLKAWHDRGVALRQLYGMTEIGGSGTVPRPDDALARPEFCGDGSVFTEFRTVRADDSDCDPGEEGQILMRGPGMMRGYWNNQKATEEMIVDGWIHSGDLGVLDEDGYLRFVDRLKDMVISGGFNISPTEVENAIAETPGVIEVSVIAIPDKKWGEVPAAIIYADRPIDRDTLIKELRQKLAGFKVPGHIVQIDKPLPRMVSGKIAKRKLAAEYAHLGDKQLNGN